MKYFGLVLIVISLSGCLGSKDFSNDNCTQILERQTLSDGTKMYTITSNGKTDYTDKLPPNLCPKQRR